jgi:hypothetical protein
MPPDAKPIHRAPETQPSPNDLLSLPRDATTGPGTTESMARWVTQMATGLPKDHPSDATTLETLHLVRLKQAAERSGLLQVWRAHEELRKQSRASPNRMYPQAREALNTLFFVESRYRSHGHLHAFSDLLARNDSKVAREVQQLANETSRTLDSYRAALTNIGLSIVERTELESPLSLLHTCHQDYLAHSEILATRLNSDKPRSENPGRGMLDMSDLRPSTEIDLLLFALRDRSLVEAGMSIRVACDSVLNLLDISKRVLCRMIARQLGLPY